MSGSRRYTSRDLAAYLRERHIAGEIIYCPAPTPTVEAAALVMGVHPDQIVKTILFLVAGQPVAVISCGTRPIERRPIAERYSVGRKQVKLASAEAVLALTGYPAGALPPFGFHQPLPTFIDERILAQPLIYAGGGEADALMRLDPRDLPGITHGEVLSGLASGGESD